MAAATNQPGLELACNGIVTFGEHTFHDQLLLKTTSNDDVKISGVPGSTSAFEGFKPYRICINTQDEMTFEYTLGGACGTAESTRYGNLQKSAGTLKLSRIDKDAAFSGVYACHSDHRTKN